MKRILLMLVLGFSLQVFAQDLGKVKEEIKQKNNEMVKAILANDHETPLKLYTKDAISLPSYSPMLRGFDQIKKSSDEASKSNTKFKTFDIETQEVYGDGKYFIEIGTYNMDMTMGNNPESIKDKGKYITVWEKQSDGSLKIKTDTWNTDINPWAEMNKNHGESKAKSDKETEQN